MNDVTKIKYNYGKIVKKVRQRACLTQGELAKVLNIEQGTVSKIEKNQLSMKAEMWLFFCKKYKVNPMKLLSRAA
jgi:DNA-binding XRE family transcriptional regulator